MTRPQAKRIAGAAALLLAVYLAALVFLFPADIAWRAVEARLELPVTVVTASVSGRIWSGQAQGLRVDGHEVGSVIWRLQPAALLGGRLGLALRWESGGDRVDARLRLGTRSARATKVRGGLDASRIQAWFDLPLLLDGRLELDLPRVRWTADGGVTDAAGRLLWADAGAGLPRPMRLGEYRAELAADSGRLEVRIDSGPDSTLAAEGYAFWDPVGEYNVDLELRAAAGADQNLAAALDNIALVPTVVAPRLSATTAGGQLTISFTPLPGTECDLLRHHPAEPDPWLLVDGQFALTGPGPVHFTTQLTAARAFFRVAAYPHYTAVVTPP